VRAAQGYVELGMPQDASVELDEIPAELQQRLEVVLLRLETLRLLKRWDDGASFGRAAIVEHPSCGPLYLVTAYAIRRCHGIEEARALLISGEGVLADEAMFHFNVACYECQLGNLAGAKHRLLKAFELNPRYRQIGKEDPDLQPLHDWL
jgi:hypothetical protein